MRYGEEIKGVVQRVKGRVKQSVARVTNNEELRNSGVLDEVTGAARVNVARAARETCETLNRLVQREKRSRR